jgi:hypothetical protein
VAVWPQQADQPRRDIADVLAQRSDLSAFVVHLTRDHPQADAKQNLRSIIQQRVLRAGEPKGWATWERFQLPNEVLESQRVVCFSETPLEYARALFEDIAGRTVQLKPYGLALPRMVARWMGVSPVWYVDMSRAPGQWRDWHVKNALNELVAEATENFAASPIARLTPFIEGMGSWPNPDNGGVRVREFSWEREWRHVGDLNLEPWWDKILWLCPEVEIPELVERLGHRHCIDPSWSLERIIGHLMGLSASDVSPFSVR